MSAVSGKAVLDAVLVVEQRGSLEMASRVLEVIGMVFRYGASIGEVHADVAGGLRQFLAKRPPVQHFPHVDEASIPEPLRRIDGYHGRPETRYAMQLLVRTFPRTKELIYAQWTEINFETATWEIPAARMKGDGHAEAMGAESPDPAVAAVHCAAQRTPAVSGRHEHLFLGMRNPRDPISSETINKSLRAMGFEN